MRAVEDHGRSAYPRRRPPLSARRGGTGALAQIARSSCTARRKRSRFAALSIMNWSGWPPAIGAPGDEGEVRRPGVRRARRAAADRRGGARDLAVGQHAGRAGRGERPREQDRVVGREQQRCRPARRAARRPPRRRAPAAATRASRAAAPRALAQQRRDAARREAQQRRLGDDDDRQVAAVLEQRGEQQQRPERRGEQAAREVGVGERRAPRPGERGEHEQRRRGSSRPAPTGRAT